MKIPLSHKLPKYLKLHQNYSQNLGRIIRIANKHKPIKVLDIGANIGDSVLIIKNYANVPILCIEGNHKYTGLLYKNTQQFSNVSVQESYIGAETDNKYKVINESGTARLSLDDVNGATVDILSMESILSKHKNFSDFNFLKIDTDGFDNKIIRDSLSSIEENKPIVFFEYDPYFLKIQGEVGTDVFDLLKSIGYKYIMVYFNVGDYLLSCELNDHNILSDLHNYVCGRGGLVYYDVCVFHEKDKDIFDNIRESELDYFRKFRKF